MVCSAQGTDTTLCACAPRVAQAMPKDHGKPGSPDPNLQREPSGFLSIVICLASISHLPRKGSVGLDTVGVSWSPDLSMHSTTSACTSACAACLGFLVRGPL